MIIDENGRIAFHSYQIRPDGFYFVQYGFKGEVLEEKMVESYEPIKWRFNPNRP